MLHLWTAPRCWPGETVFILASGPSVKQLDLSPLKGRRVIAVKSSHLTWPTADVLFFADSRWWRDPKLKPRTFEGLIVSTATSIADKASRARIRMMLKRNPVALAEERHAVALERTSTTGAINLAVHFGAARIVLLGVDGKIAPDGTRHCHGVKWPYPLVETCFDDQAREYAAIAPSAERLGVEIVNANPDSAISVWPRKPFQDCL
jgi:hypothetical protein